MINNTVDELSASPSASLVYSLVESAEERFGVGSMFFSTSSMTGKRAHRAKSSQFCRS